MVVAAAVRPFRSRRQAPDEAVGDTYGKDTYGDTTDSATFMGFDPDDPSVRLREGLLDLGQIR